MDNDYVRLLEDKVNQLSNSVDVLNQKIDRLADENLKLKESFNSADNRFCFMFLLILVSVVIIAFLGANYVYPMYQDWKSFSDFMNSIGSLQSYLQ